MNKVKIALIGLALSLGVVNAKAATEIFDIQCDSITIVSTATVASGIVTPLFAATLNGAVTSYLNIMPNRKWLEIVNLSTGTNVLVGFDVNKSTTPADWLTFNPTSRLSTTNGKMIGPNGGFFHLGANGYDSHGYPIIPLAVTTGSAATNLTIVQCGAP